MISATEVPDSACRERDLLFRKVLLFHPKNQPFLVMSKVKTLRFQEVDPLAAVFLIQLAFHGLAGAAHS